MEPSRINNIELARIVARDPVHWPAFGFGFGLMPFAPGTWGSLPGIAIWWFLPKEPYVQAAAAVLMFLAGIWICGESARRIGVHDHGGIVWDEIVGMYVTLFLAPVSIVGFVLAFVLFRIMDIVKPWPIRDLDHSMRGGLGIMLDDLLAAVYAAVLLALYGWFVT